MSKICLSKLSLLFVNITKISSYVLNMNQIHNHLFFIISFKKNMYFCVVIVIKRGFYAGQQLFVQYCKNVQVRSVYIFAFKIPIRINSSISMAQFVESRTQTANKIFSKITEGANYKEELFKRIQVYSK